MNEEKMNEEKILKIKNAFIFISIIFFITVIFICLIEGFAYCGYLILGHQFLSNNSIDYRLDNEVYANKSWAPACFKEDVNVEYYPYIGYRRIPNSHGECINLNEEALRYTWNPPSSAINKSIKIFCFGGSTMWGTGARDNFTIPSFLSKKLYDRGYSVEITNFGETGYVSTQELIRLELELRKGNIPDLVIFYDGINDDYSSYQNKIAGFPLNMEKHQIEYNSYSQTGILYFITPAIKNSYSFIGVKYVLSKIKNDKTNITNVQYSDREFPNLSNATVDVYFNNVDFIKSLERSYGFKSYFFIQPTIFTKKDLSSTEQSISDKDQNNYVNLKEFLTICDNVTRSRINSSHDKNIYYLGEAYNNKNTTIFIDMFHTSEEGNQIIADNIMNEIINDLPKKR